MADFNKVILVGRLTRDPELRYVSSGTAVCEISIAIGRRWKGTDGQMRDETTFVDVVFWGRQAENINQYFRKGSQILVEGRINQDRWEDKNTGQKRSKLNVVAERFEFLDRRGENRGQGGQQGGQQGGNYQGGSSSGAFLGGGAPQGGSAPQNTHPAPQQERAPQNPAAAAFDDNFDIEGDDIPF